MEQNQDDLIDRLFRVGCFKIEETRLKSGFVSPVHIDVPMINGNPIVLRNLATAVYAKFCDLKFDLICAASFASIPLVVTLSIDNHIPMIIKSCDLKNNNSSRHALHGPHFPGQKVLLIDDVITLGSSLIESTSFLRSIGLQVEDAIVIVDQTEHNNEFNVLKTPNIRSLLKLSEIVNYLTAKGIYMRPASARSQLTPAFSQRSFPNVHKLSCLPINSATESKSKSFLRFFSRSKKLDQPMSPRRDNFFRGGIRATAGPRLVSEERKMETNKPFNRWDNVLVCQWLTSIGLGMYSGYCRKWNGTGEQLLNCAESEIEKELCIKNKLHRKKLRLALLVANNNVDYLSKAASRLDYLWIARWLDDIGLPQYKEPFLEARINGSVLHQLTVADLVRLNINSKLHYCSLKRGIQVLREHDFDPNCLIRRSTPDELSPPNLRSISLWTLHRVMEWLRSIDLSEYTSNLRGSGVHGALIVHETAFDSDLFASLLGIPTSRTLLRRHLFTHFQQLIGAELMQLKIECRAKNSPLLAASKLTLNQSKFLLIKRRIKTNLHPSELICPLSPDGTVNNLTNGNQNISETESIVSDNDLLRTDSETESSV